MNEKNSTKGMGLSLLKYFCEATYGQIAEMFDATIDSKGNIFIDNDSKILAVAHMDVVNRHQRFELLNDKNTVFNPQLDDRLGIYTLYILWKVHKLNFDILLTIDEEKMDSSAQYFKTDKKYNWMFQFDRAGNNQCVMYQYDNKESEAILKNVGIELEMGSYSDIAELSHLGCIGFNWGVAYYRQHTKDCYMKIDEYKSQVRKFKRFYEMYKDTHMPFDSKAYEDRYANYRSYRNSSYYDSWSPNYGVGGGPSSPDFNDDKFWDDYYYHNGAYIRKGGKYDKLQNDIKVRSAKNNENLIKNIANKQNSAAAQARDNDKYWDEAKYYNRYMKRKAKRGATKVIDFRESVKDVNLSEEMRKFNKQNDDHLNEHFGGIVEKNGTKFKVFWKDGRAFYEEVSQDINKDEVIGTLSENRDPEPYTRDWYMQLPPDFAQAEAEKKEIAAREALMAEVAALDAGFANAIRDI